MISQMILYVLAFILGPALAFAAPNSLTYQGRILKADGKALEHNNVSFVFEITSSDGLCTLYREQRDGVNMTGSNGVFDVPIGSGTKLFPTDPGFKLSDSFVNGSLLNCSGGATWTPPAESVRLLKVQFHDGAGWRVLDPPNVIRSVPYSHFSYSAQKLGNLTANDLLLKSQSPPTACAAGEVITFDGTNFSCITDQGGSGVVSSVAGTAPITVTGTGNVTVGISVGTTAGTVAAGNDARITGAFQNSTALGGDLSGNLPNPTVAKIQNISVSATAPGNGQVLRYNSTGSQWQPVNFGVDDLMSSVGTPQFASAACTTNQTLTWSSLTDTFTCANISISESNISGSISGTKISGNISGLAAGFTGTLAGDVSGTQGATSVDKIKGTAVNLTGLADGQVLRWNNGANEWQPATDSNSGGTITSLTGDVTASGSGAVNATIAANAVTSGKIADSTIVNADISASAAIADSKLATLSTAGKVANSATTANASSVADTLVLRDSSGNFSANAVSFSAVNIRNGSANKVTLNVPASFTDYSLTLPASPGVAGQMLSTNGAPGVLSWVTPNTGTVTTVSATTPLNVANATTTPEISIGAGSGDAQVLRWNTTAWSSSYLNFADLKSSAGLRQIPGTCTVAQSLIWQSASDTFACTNISITASQVSNVFAQGGNSFAAEAALGTNDNQALSLRTNGTSRVFVGPSGSVGIGTTAPGARLQVSGSTTIPMLSVDGTTAATGSALRGIVMNPTVNTDTSASGGVAISPKMELTTSVGGIFYGNIFNPSMWNSSGSITGRFAGNYFRADTGAGYTGNISTLNVIEVGSPNHAGSGTISNVNAIRIADQTSGTTNYGVFQEGTDDLNYFGGNVGIGAVTPTHPLTIAKGTATATFNDALMINNPTNNGVGTGSSILMNAISANGVRLYTSVLNASAGSESTDFKIQNYRAGAWVNRFMVSANGQVGIGTMNPGARLSVTGTASSTANDLKYVISAMDDSTSAANVGGGISFGGKVDTAGTYGVFGLIYGAKDNATDADTAGSLVFGTTPNAGAVTERMRITSAGRLGLGTASPETPVDVRSDIDGFAAVRSRNFHNSATNAYAGFATESDSAAIEMVSYSSTNSASFGGVSAADSVALRSWSGKPATNMFVGTGSPSPLYLLTNNAPRLTINSGGQVGIGTTSPSYNLHVVGTAGLSTGTAWTNASDERLKDIHGDYEYGLNEVLQLHTVRYNYKKDNPLRLPSSHNMTGFIAQEVQKVIPDAVKVRPDGYLELNVDPIHWAVVNAIQEVYQENQKLKARVQELEKDNDIIKAALCRKDPTFEFCKSP